MILKAGLRGWFNWLPETEIKRQSHHFDRCRNTHAASLGCCTGHLNLRKHVGIRTSQLKAPLTNCIFLEANLDGSSCNIHLNIPVVYDPSFPSESSQHTTRTNAFNALERNGCKERLETPRCTFSVHCWSDLWLAGYIPADKENLNFRPTSQPQPTDIKEFEKREKTVRDTRSHQEIQRPAEGASKVSSPVPSLSMRWKSSSSCSLQR